ncbi:hypothetical protein LJR034_005191 [Caballeronia sp. LjRoot34]|uniref:hypothetical protein n=1 Tax=Caballeronia sp. LjRoot34 TaxID=3342325 RepID=UPI003ECFA9F1
MHYLAQSDRQAREEIAGNLTSELRNQNVMKDAGTLWSPASGIGPYIRWMLGVLACAEQQAKSDTENVKRFEAKWLQEESLAVYIRLDMKVHQTVDAHISPPFLDNLINRLNAKFRKGCPQITRVAFMEEPFFSSADAPRQYFSWLVTGIKIPSTNFQLLKATQFFQTTERKTVVDKLVSDLRSRDARSLVRPLLVVESRGAPNSLTALATNLRERWEADVAESPPMLYINASRLESGARHKSLGYYVSVISTWLENGDVEGASPIVSRNEIYEKLANIRRMLGTRRTVVVLDGVDADGGVLEEMISIIDDNPVAELIQNLIMPCIQASDNAGGDPSREVVRTSVLVLTDGIWDKFEAMTRFHERLPTMDGGDAAEVYRTNGYRYPEEVALVTKGRLCPETESALIDALLCTDTIGPADLSEDELVTAAIETPSVEGRVALFRRLRETLPEATTMVLRLIAVCPGGVRFETARRCLLGCSSAPALSSLKAEGFSDDFFNQLIAQFPMLFVLGEDETLEIDSIGARLDYPGLPKQTVVSAKASPGETDSEKSEIVSLDIGRAELKELIVADLVGSNLDLWFLIHDVLAEESVGQWVNSLKVFDQAEQNNIASHRRLIQALWHGFQSRPYGQGPEMDEKYVALLPSSIPRSSDAERYLYLTAVLLRRCLEGGEGWLLGRAFSRHRLRLCLIATANNPSRMREHVAKESQWQTVSIAEGREKGSSAPTMQSFFENFPFVTPYVCQTDVKGPLTPNQRLSFEIDHLVTFARSAIDSGFNQLSLRLLEQVKRVAHQASGLRVQQLKGNLSTAAGIELDLLEHSDAAAKADSILRGRLEELGFSEYYLDDHHQNDGLKYPSYPVDVETMMSKVADIAAQFDAEPERGEHGSCISVLLRYAETKALMADRLEGPAHRTQQYPQFTSVIRLYLLADKLRAIWYSRSPFANDLSARPTRYFVRVALKLAVLCGDAASSFHEIDSRFQLRWQVAANSFWQLARQGAHLYAQRYFRFEQECAYMSILEASFARTLAVHGVRMGVDTFGKSPRESLAIARFHLDRAEEILSRLCFPLSPTRRFLLEVVKYHRATVKLALQSGESTTSGGATIDNDVQRAARHAEVTLHALKWLTTHGQASRSAFWAHLVQVQTLGASRDRAMLESAAWRSK